MAPRKSLPARLATPAQTNSRKRKTPNSTPARPQKRQRRAENHVEPEAEAEAVSSSLPPLSNIEPDGLKGEPDADEVVLEPTEEELEAELEAWQDFAADHYEMVEQLPLELHRNFRLLRELDDGCTAQTAMLLERLREYLTYRLGEKKAPETAPTGESHDADVADREPTSHEEADVDSAAAKETEDASIAAPPKPPVDGVVNGPEDFAAPVSDGQGGVMLPPEEPMSLAGHASPGPSRAEEPVAETAQAPTPEATPAGRAEQAEPTGQAAHSGSAPPARLPREGLLQEIGRLSREILRNAEEKAAIAVGAYNTVDRHIRALDSALSSQEASILLGLRNDTLPSTAVDTSLNLAGDHGAINQADDGEITLGLGGGRTRQKGKKGKRGKKEDVVKPAEEVFVPIEIEADPSEPRYCFCHQVSYGEMVGCDNDDCAIEWFHLACVGLAEPPNGSWFCSDCKPDTGLGKATGGNTGKAARRKSGGSRKRR